MTLLGLYSDTGELPDKLADFIEQSENDPQADEAIVGAGDIQLTSEDPVSVVEYFLLVNQNRQAEATFDDYSYDLTRFLEFAASAGLDDLSDISSSDIESFKQWREKDGNICLATLHGQLANLRVFLRACERWEIVEDGTADDIEMPELSASDIVSYTRIKSERAKTILNHYEDYDTTREQAEFAVIWALLPRLGGVRSLDLDNYDEDENGDPYLELTSDPEEDTPLKNGEGDVEGEGGERQLNIPEWVCDLLDDYIKKNRISVTDEYSRKPLFTTRQGRVSKSTLRRDLYRITQPCQLDQGCPHDRDPAECEAKHNNQLLSRCPSAVSPHPVRRGGICHQLKQGVSKDLICERADVSRQVLNKHYDIRTKEEARKQRREELKNKLDGYGSADDNCAQDGSRKQETQTLREAVADTSPILQDIRSATAGIELEAKESPISERTIKGAAAYVTFVTLTGINLALTGIGFNPVTMNLILPT